MHVRRKGDGGSVPVVPPEVGLPDTLHSTRPRVSAGRAGLQRRCSSLRAERGPQAPGSEQGRLLQPRGSLLIQFSAGSRQRDNSVAAGPT